MSTNNMSEAYKYYQGGEYLKALQFYEIEANKNVPTAQYNAAIMCELLKTADYIQKAIHYYQKAIDNGYLKAATALGKLYFYATHVDRDLEKARKLFLIDAEKGHAPAQYYLGYIYYGGFGVEKDYQKAYQFFHQAAVQGNAESQYRLGEMYVNGYGLKKNFEEAVKWLRMAAEQGHMHGQGFLADRYKNGQGVKQDLAEAEKWYAKAAVQGYDSAQYLYGTLLWNRGVYVEGLKWIKAAAEKLHVHAMFELGYLYFYIENEEMDLPKPKEGEKWLYKAAEAGHPRAQHEIGVIKAERKNAKLSLSENWLEEAKKDINEGIKWLTMAAEGGYDNSLVYLGCMYVDGQKVEKDYNKASEYFIKLIRKGNPLGHYHMGRMYFFGCLTRDMYKAKDFLETAASHGIQGAQYLYFMALKEYKGDDQLEKLEKAVPGLIKVANAGLDVAEFELGLCYKDGIGVSRDLNECVKWLTRAADKGNIMAQGHLADRYKKGEGVSRNMAKAKELYLKSATGGYSCAQGILGVIYMYEKKYSEALKWLTLSPKAGFVAAETFLGYMYFKGLGCPKNKEEAIRLFTSANSKGEKHAQHIMQVLTAGKEFTLDAGEGAGTLIGSILDVFLSLGAGD